MGTLLQTTGELRRDPDFLCSLGFREGPTKPPATRWHLVPPRPQVPLRPQKLKTSFWLQLSSEASLEQLWGLRQNLADQEDFLGKKGRVAQATADRVEAKH